MNRFIAMVILKPDIEKGELDFVQSNIISLFEQKVKLKKVWFLGNKELDYKINQYSKGYHFKLELEAKLNKIEELKQILKSNDNIIFSVIMDDKTQKDNLSKLKRHSLSFCKSSQESILETNKEKVDKVYILINKNIKIPFAESDILAISTDIQSIFDQASKKIREYLFVKGYRTTKKIKNIKDVEKEFKKNWKAEFIFGENLNVGQQLLIQEINLI